MRAPEAGAQVKILNFLQESGIFSHLEEKAVQIVDLFTRLGGGCWSTLITPLATGLLLQLISRTIPAMNYLNACNVNFSFLLFFLYMLETFDMHHSIMPVHFVSVCDNVLSYYIRFCFNHLHVVRHYHVSLHCFEPLFIHLLRVYVQA